MILSDTQIASRDAVRRFTKEEINSVGLAYESKSYLRFIRTVRFARAYGNGHAGRKGRLGGGYVTHAQSIMRIAAVEGAFSAVGIRAVCSSLRAAKRRPRCRSFPA